MIETEALGFDAVLIPQHTVNPYSNALDQLDAWSAAAALAALTTRIEIIAAIKPGLTDPVVLAKAALGIEAISGGRFALNLVNAWNRLEFVKAGLPFAEHDQRYAYGREWIEVVKRLMAGENVSFSGEHFWLDNYRLQPASVHRSPPRIYVGGESDPARALVADHGDAWIINGQQLEDMADLVHDLARRPREGRRCASASRPS